MISTEASPRRMRLGLAVMVGLGLSVLSLPALAGAGDREPGLLRGAEASGQPQLPLGDEGAVPGSMVDAPLVVADNYKNKNWNNNWTNPNYNRNWNNKNWNNNWNNNWNKNAKKNWNKNYPNKYWNKNYVRTWKPRPYYGQFFGGVVLGSILTAAAIGIAPPAPAPGLCWYWSDPYGYRGYWDYCAPYPPY
jgi:hypothetical protein